MMGSIPDMGHRLRELREAKNWTQDFAAQKFGMSKSGYIKIERGERKLDDDRIEKAKEVYGVSGAEVIGEIDAEIDEKRQAILDLFDSLPDEEKEVAVQQLESLARLASKRRQSVPHDQD